MDYLTKFRAFQLDSEGSLFSFYKPGWYTLIEARIPKGGISILQNDLALHAKTRVDTLHITSWDSDHCNFLDLDRLLSVLLPKRIEYPSYSPNTEEGRRCLTRIFQYQSTQTASNIQSITQEYVRGLSFAEPGGISDVIVESQYNCVNKNDMSLLKLFRSNGFNVLSLGDCESEEIASRIITYPEILREVDILILPHHGADNGFISGKLLDAIKPKIAICSSNYDNQYDHPRPSICQLLSNRDIPVMTTKRGDVIIFQTSGENAIALNYVSDNNKTENNAQFIPKRVVRSNQAA